MRGGLTDSCSRLSTFGMQGALTRGGPYPHRSTPAAPVLYVPFSDLGGGVASADYQVGSGAQPTHTRATADWTRLANGLWTQVPAGSLRSYYNEDGVYCGALFEGSNTNTCKWNRDLTNPVWVKTGAPTVAKDGTGMDGVANSCSTITCGAAGDTVGQTIVLVSDKRQGAFWLKRLVGTGTVEVTIDGGATWHDVTSQLSTTHFRFCAPPVQTLANPNLVLRMGTPGDKVAVDMASLGLSLNGAYNCITTPIETAAVNVTRNPDLLGGYDAANISNDEGTFYAECSTLYSTNGNVRCIAHVVSGGTTSFAYIVGNTAAAHVTVHDGTVAITSVDLTKNMDNTVRRLATSWGVPSGVKWACYEGSLLNPSGIPSYSAYDGSMGTITGVWVSRGTSAWRGCVKELRIWTHQLDINVVSAIVNRGGR